MLDDIKKELTSFRLLAILLTIAVSIYLAGILWQVLSSFSDVIIVLVMSWLLSFILEPLVNFISRIIKVPKLWGALIVYLFFVLLFTGMVFIIIPVISAQFQSLSKLIPQYLSSYPNFIQTWNNFIKNSADTLISLIPSLASFFLNTILVLFLSFYLIVDKERINKEIYSLAPKNWHKNLHFIQQVIDTTFTSFLRLQIIIGIIAGISTWIALTIFSVSFAASVSLISGLLTTIPIIGPILAIIPPVLIILITEPNNLTKTVIIFAVLLLIQQILANAVGPKLMGNAFKLHPIVVFISIILAFKIAGPLGAVFIVPVLGILVVVIKRLGVHFINPENN